MITVRRARVADAIAIGAVHVAAWRSAYPGILPDNFLARLSVPRQAAHYEGAIRAGAPVYVAAVNRQEAQLGTTPRVVGFATGGRGRVSHVSGHPLAEGEIETLYVLDDFRDHGIGRRLMRTLGAHLAEGGCRSAYVWVLRDNPSRWFYERMGGRKVAEALVQVGGHRVMQTAFVWNPIERLLEASPQAS